MVKLLFFFFLTLSGICQLLAGPYERTECEPHDLKYGSPEQWIERYDIPTNKLGFTEKKFFKRTRKYTNESTGETKDLLVSLELLEIKQTGKLHPLRRYSRTIVWHFHHGDAVVFHNFDPVTKEYTTVELGFHTNKFYHVTPAYNWYATDFVKHQDETFVVISNSIVAVDKLDYTFEFGEKEYLLDLFPMHAEHIEELYQREIYDSSAIDK